MNKIELLKVDCRKLTSLSGLGIQDAFGKHDRYTLLCIEYPELPVRSVLLIAPTAHVIRFYRPSISEAASDESRKLLDIYHDKSERLLADAGLGKRSLAPFSSVIEDTIFENDQWPIPLSIAGSYVHERFVEQFSDYVSGWVYQLAEWVACEIDQSTFSSPDWYFDQVDRFLMDNRLRAFGALWRLVPGEGWFETNGIREAVSKEIWSLRNGDDSIRLKLLQSPVFAQRDQNRSALLISVLPSKRIVCQLRPGQSISELMEKFDETLLLRAQLIAEVNSPLSYFFAKEIIDGAEQSIQLSREHAGEAVNESISLLKAYRARQEEMYPILVALCQPFQATAAPQPSPFFELNAQR